MESKQTGSAPAQETKREPDPEEKAVQEPEAAAAPSQESEEAKAPEAEKKADKADKPDKAEKPHKKEKAELVALRAENESLTKELAAQKDSYQRMLAEYANYKRRTEQEKERLGEYIRSEMLKALLVSLDNMERAIAAPAGDEYKTGVDMVLRQFRETLMGMGLQEIEAEGMAFNPEVHNAVMREDADGVEPETVTAVFQKGYRYGERVLRPAMVKVAN